MKHKQKTMHRVAISMTHAQYLDLKIHAIKQDINLSKLIVDLLYDNKIVKTKSINKMQWYNGR